MSDIILPFSGESLRVRTFSFYIHDVRYSAPTLKLAQAANEVDARRKAQAWLEESDHHQVIEVFEDDRPVLRLPENAPEGLLPTR
jgi:hypothetical protein